MEQILVRGLGSIERLPEMLSLLGIRRPLYIMSRRARASLNLDIGSAPVFSGFHSNPEWDDTEMGAALCREKGCDGLVSLGGGSCMDTAKAIKARLLCREPERAMRGDFTPERFPHLAIPCTAGTGAESTPFAVIYREERKYSLSNPCLLPDGVILDGSITQTLPDYHRKSCMLDALCQGIESFWSRGATEESSVYALEAAAQVVQTAPAYLAGEPEAAQTMLEAANRSGQAIAVSRTTAAHAMSYGMTKQLAIAHGYACALTLPYLWRQMLGTESMRQMLETLSERVFGVPAEEGPSAFMAFMLSLHLPEPVKPNEAILEQLASTVNAERLSNHPFPETQENLKQIYREALSCAMLR